jgi:hypothetical protein
MRFVRDHLLPESATAAGRHDPIMPARRAAE